MYKNKYDIKIHRLFFFFWTQKFFFTEKFTTSLDSFFPTCNTN